MHGHDLIRFFGRNVMSGFGRLVSRPQTNQTVFGSVHCPHCMGAVRPDWRLCPHCGNLMTQHIPQAEEQ